MIDQLRLAVRARCHPVKTVKGIVEDDHRLERSRQIDNPVPSTNAIQCASYAGPSPIINKATGVIKDGIHLG